MAGHGDTEAQSADVRDEETPLLAEQRIESRGLESDQNELGTSGNRDAQSKSLSWYLWRGFCVLVAALALGVFIQGWINAGGDVDVGYD